jgi:hypothetical protein
MLRVSRETRGAGAPSLTWRQRITTDETRCNAHGAFNGWFVHAGNKLKELPEGDGAFAAMMIVLSLYERCIIATLKLNGEAARADDIARAIGTDLDEQQRRVFWAMFRTGFMHQAMVQAGATQWVVSDRFGGVPEFRLLNGHTCVCIDPWKFADRVLRTFANDPRLIIASESFPLADVFAVDGNALS